MDGVLYVFTVFNSKDDSESIWVTSCDPDYYKYDQVSRSSFYVPVPEGSTSESVKEHIIEVLTEGGAIVAKRG